MLHPKVKQHAQIVFSYLFGEITKYEYRRLLGDRELAKEIWSLVVDNGYVLCNCKLYLYALRHAEYSGQSVKPSKYEIAQPDVRVLKSIQLGVTRRYKVYSLEEFRSMETAFIVSRNMDAYIGKFINKKLRFLCNSYGLKHNEIQGDLQCKALYALRKQYPAYKSELHALNICKTAIQNAGQGLIEYWTREKRNALRSDGQGFQSVHVQLEHVNSSVTPEHDDELRVNLQSLIAVASRLTEAQQMWIKAATGLHDTGFSFFIGRDNSDVVDLLPYDRYLKLVCDYHRIPQEAMLKQLRNALA